jgi:co-chaperonin GroES (HSP10)
MSRGDILAAGGKSANFQASQAGSDLENDLKLLPKEDVERKYGLDKGTYEELVGLLRAGGPLPDLKVVEAGSPVPPEPVFAPKGIPRNGKLAKSERRKPSFGYIGSPGGDNVLIQRVEKEHTSTIILPDSMKAKSEIGFVKAVGKACKTWKPGQLVLFDKFASHGAENHLLDEQGIEREYLLLREYDILMALKKVPLK